jgi:hypothetical protein
MARAARPDAGGTVEHDNVEHDNVEHDNVEHDNAVERDDTYCVAYATKSVWG